MSRQRAVRRPSFRPLLELLEDRRLPATFIVTNTNDDGDDSLRAAIIAANANPGPDTITFAIGAVGSQQTINVGSTTGNPLPAITAAGGPVIIDGWSQGGGGYTGPALIQLNGAAAGSGADGLEIQAGDSTVRGMVINRFNGSGILINTLGGNVLHGNVFGLDFAGDQHGNFKAGILIQDVPNNTIGGTDPSFRNVISGSDAPILGMGLWIQGANASGNIVRGNFIGTSLDGMENRQNTATGVYIDNAPNNIIGGTTAAARNVISGNGVNGVGIEGFTATGNVVQGNIIGLAVDGQTPLPQLNFGVSVAASNNIIGGTVAGAGNVISGNDLSGVLIFAGSGNVVQGNLIGTDITGTLDRGNRQDGVLLGESAFFNLIGGVGAAARNVISGNDYYGVSIDGPGGGGNMVLGNYIGTDITGTVAIGNELDGVLINNVAGNTIGGTVPGAGNLISGNKNNGILVFDDGATNNLIQGNRIGTNADGTAALPNQFNGIHLDGAVGNTVGGAATGAGNLISGNVLAGVAIENGADSNTLQGNLIGVNLAGTAALANGVNGILVDGSANTLIGGTASGAGNVISGNMFVGIQITGAAAAATVIRGNTIGLDAARDVPIPNEFVGIGIQGAPGTVIGGTQAGARNVISGNGTDGIFITSPGGGGNVIQNNIIGLDGTGTQRRGNGENGILILGVSNNVIGGSAPNAGNIISSNADGDENEGGISIGASHNNIIQGNLIGTDITGTVNLGNASHGIIIGSGSTNNLVGGTGAGARNVISGNGFDPVSPGAGVIIIDFSPSNVSSGNVIQGNYIGTDITGTVAMGNAIGGVVIFDGPTANLIGGLLPGQGNLISGNAGVNNPPTAFGDGVVVRNADGNLILNNRVGTDAAGTAALGNFGSGVLLEDADGNTVAGNLVSGNNGNGVHVLRGKSNLIRGNLIGTDAGGSAALGNRTGGVRLEDSQNNTVGGLDADHRNVISGNGDASNDAVGVLITGATSTGNVVLGNFIGTNAAGTGILANSFNGVEIDGGSNNVIGGDSAAARNVISGNGPSGPMIANAAVAVMIQGASATNNQVMGNYLGTDVTGTVALPNGSGVLIVQAGAGNVVGGLLPGQMNLISGNQGQGVAVAGSAAQIIGNWIGLNAAGTAALPNQQDGIFLNQATGVTVSNNVVSGNAVNGVSVNLGSTNTTLTGNLIGTNAAGTAAVGNGFNGVLIDLGATGTTVGGTTAAARNVISGNQFGVRIINPGSSNNVVRGNFIGTDVTGTAAVANQFDGVLVSGPGPVTGNLIGGRAAGAGNTIAFNGRDGVRISGEPGNPILGNSIFRNGGLGIKLVSGGNGNQGAPKITKVTNRPNGVDVQGTMRDAPNRRILIQIFASTAADPSGQGEGQTLVGSVFVRTNASGVARFKVRVQKVAGQRILTATATDQVTNNTSEFSRAVKR